MVKKKHNICENKCVFLYMCTEIGSLFQNFLQSLGCQKVNKTLNELYNFSTENVERHNYLLMQPRHLFCTIGQQVCSSYKFKFKNLRYFFLNELYTYQLFPPTFNTDRKTKSVWFYNMIQHIRCQVFSIDESCLIDRHTIISRYTECNAFKQCLSVLGAIETVYCHQNFELKTVCRDGCVTLK